MPSGLTNSSLVFQALVNDVLRDFINIHTFVYLDDIVIFSKDLESHKNHIHAILFRLLQNNLFVKAEKCEFHHITTTFLGFNISPEQISIDPSKASAVKDWPTPQNRNSFNVS